VDLRVPELLHWGFDPVTVWQSIHTGSQGEQVADVYDGNKIFAVSVVLPAHSPEIYGVHCDVTYQKPGWYLGLAGPNLPSVYEKQGRYKHPSRRGTAGPDHQLECSGWQRRGLVSNAQAQIAQKVHLAPGNYVQFTGTAAAQAQSSRRDLMNHFDAEWVRNRFASLGLFS